MSPEYKIICGDCLNWLNINDLSYDTIFADPPDNIGLKYDSYNDKISDETYIDWLERCTFYFIDHAKTVWLSYNSKWVFNVGNFITDRMREKWPIMQAKSFVQTFTFGQHRQTDCGNNHRMLLRLRWNSAPLFPDAIRVPSCRQKCGDPRADPRGRVPGDVFDFPRVTGNSLQRRTWHPTQLHEGLVERCLKLTTPIGGKVLDPFGGTGTTLRVCKRLGFSCTIIEIDPCYCEQIAKEHKLEVQYHE